MSATFTPLGATSTYFGTFHSGNPSLARNRHGRMAAFQTSRSADYNANGFDVRFCPASADHTVPANWVSVYSWVGGTNPPSVVALDNPAGENAEFAIFYTDWVGGTAWCSLWTDISASLTPVHRQIGGNLGGKWGACSDQRLNHFIVAGNADGTVRTIRRDGTLYWAQPVFLPYSAGGDSYQYPVPVMAPDGCLFLGWCAAMNAVNVPGGKLSYSALGIAGRDENSQWRGPRGATGLDPVQGAIGLPMSPDFANPSCVMGTADNWPNTFLSCVHVDDEVIIVTYARAGDIGAGLFGNDFRDVTTVLVRYDRATGKMLTRDEELCFGPFKVKQFGMFIQRKGAALFAAVPHRHEIVLGRSDDNGETWVLVGRFAIPPFASGGTTGVYFTGMRDGQSPDAMEAVFTAVNVDADLWPESVNPPGRCFHVSIEL